jgi:hypothetical protein
MTLKEKFDNVEIMFESQIGKLKYDELCEASNQCEQIADEFAIEFGNWIGKNTITYHNGKFRMKTLTPVFRTSEQLLERFKREKGL